MSFVKKLARGMQISLEDLQQYKTLQASDVEKKEWQFAPVLVTSNRERMEITHQKAILFAKLHKTYVFKWRNKMTGWKNKPQDSSYLYDQNPMLWQYFVAGSNAFLTKNINNSLGLANGTPVVCHSLVLNKDCAEVSKVMEEIDGPNAPPYGTEIILNEAPIAVNFKIQTGLDGKQPSRAKKRQLDALRKHSILPETEEDIVIRVSERSDKSKTLKMKNGSPLLGNVSSAAITPILAYDLAFAMTVHKAQGRTISRVVIALTARPLHRLQMKYASVFVGMSRVKEADHIRLLEHGRGSILGSHQNKYGYLTNLLPQKSISMYDAGYKDTKGRWNQQRALKAKF